MKLSHQKIEHTKPHLPILIVALAFTVLGCKREAKEEKPGYEEYFTDHPIGLELQFSVSEFHGYDGAAGPPGLLLQIETKKIFGSISYGIQLTRHRRGQELIVRLDSIAIPDGTFDLEGPASASIGLDEDIEKLTFIDGTSVDPYQISISASKVKLSHSKGLYTSTRHTQVFRYPKNTFACICGTTKEHPNVCDDLIKTLRDSSSILSFSFDGPGTIPYPDSSYGNHINHPSQFFTYKNLEELKHCGAMLERFKAKHATPYSGVSMRIISWDNRHF